HLAGQGLAWIDVHADQRTDRGRELDAVQALDRNVADALRRRGRVERGFEETHRDVDEVLAGLLRAGWRHEPAAQLADAFFPDGRVLPEVAQVEGVEGEAPGPVLCVVAG